MHHYKMINTHCQQLSVMSWEICHAKVWKWPLLSTPHNGWFDFEHLSVCSNWISSELVLGDIHDLILSKITCE